ncbi:MAG: Smr/MutS family protein [Bacilli bacterium]|nr:Smr/MutS family protein [Bacilli bacterium]
MTLNEAMMITLPKIDVHGEPKDVARVLINDFINDQKKMKNEYVEIIYGNGTGALRSVTYDLLKSRKDIIEYKSPYNNRGSVIIKIDLTF